MLGIVDQTLRVANVDWVFSHTVPDTLHQRWEFGCNRQNCLIDSVADILPTMDASLISNFIDRQ